MRVGYGKIGRSMPLSLGRCGNLGGDVEMAAVVGELARRHPTDTFYLLGRNTGESPQDVGLPDNVINPWREWAPFLATWLSEFRDRRGRDAGNLTVDEQLRIVDFMDELTRDTFVNMDAHVMWLGQHGTSNFPIPRVDDRSKLTKPHDWCLYYASFILRGLNAWRDVDPLEREEVWLNADARNEHKMRDLKWPMRHPTLAQFDHIKRVKHERYYDTEHATYRFDQWTTGEEFTDVTGITVPSVWIGEARSVYSRLEVNGLAPETPFGDLISYDDTWAGRGHLGLFINEARAIGVRPELARKPILRDWVLPLNPTFIHGTWSDASLHELGIDVKPAPWSEYYDRLHSVRCTFTTPSSGSGWATAKPWEAFAGGTVCLFHPAYDTQNHILGDADPGLHEWLRVKSPRELKMRVDYLNSDAGVSTWQWLVRRQREHFERAIEEKRYLRMIEERIWRNE